MIQGSKIKFGITSDLSGLSQGIIVNGIQKNNTTESAQARDHLGNIMDIAAYTDDKNVTIDGLYVSQSLKPGTIINIDNQNYMVTSTGREESNTAFQTASINARLYPGEGPGPGPGPEPIEPNPSLCFKGVDDEGSYIQLNQYGSPDAVELVYRKNNGSWTTYNVGDVIILNRNDVVFLSGANDHFSTGGNNFYYFTIDGKTEASGNIQSLMNFSDSCTNYCFYSLFRDCNVLLTAPQLSATTLADNCYKSTFLGCTSLTSAPALPVTTLKTSCYSNMFNGCSGLTVAPYLPATTLAIDCYNYMFANCSSLSSITVEFTSWNVINSTNNWVQNVAASGIFTKPDALSEEYGDSRIPTNWREQEPVFNNSLTFKGLSSVNSVRLKKEGSPDSIVLDYKINDGVWTTYNVGDTINLNENDTVAFSGANDHFSKDGDNYYRFQLIGRVAASGSIQSLMNYSDNCDEYCYERMFQYCTNLVTAPQLPATGLADHCYFGMFQGCTSLTKAQATLPATTVAPYCYFGMFDSCTSLTATPELPATGLANWCYWSMFNGCSSLISPPELPATGLAQNCYMNMFQGCTSLTAAPALPATTLVNGCYNQMFDSCTSLTAAPELPATGLAQYCYNYMFQGCSNLSSISVAFTSWSNTTDWVDGVAASGIFYKPSALSAEYGVSRIPNGWTVVNKDQPTPNPLTFKGLSSVNSVRLKKEGSPDAVELVYSKNNGSWTTYNVGDTIDLNENDIVAFSGNNDHFSKDGSNYYRFLLFGTIAASGSIQSLLNFSDTAPSSCFRSLFTEQFSTRFPLITAPDLPATILCGGCYSNIFNNCQSLLTAPSSLPATKLADSCYYNMFYSCTSLTAAPTLHGFKLAENCYYNMFYGCTSLTDAPDINPQDPYAYFPNCCDNMFYGCTSLSSISVNFITWDAKNHFSFTNDWMYNVASTGKFYKLPQLSAEYGVSRIPNGWTVVNKYY